MNQATGITFDALFDNVSMGIIIVDQSGFIVMTNSFLQKQFGYSAEEMAGQRIELLIPSRFHEKHIGHVDKYNGNPRNRPMGIGMDLYATRKDRTEFPVEVSLGSYETDKGHFVTAFVSDITKRKEAENSLKQLNEELEAKVQERTKSLTESIKELAKLIAETEAKDTELVRVNAFLNRIWMHTRAILIVTDPVGNVMMLNVAGQRQLGYTEIDVIGIPFTKFLATPVGEENYANLDESRSITDFSVVKSLADSDSFNEIESYYVRKNQTVMPVSVTITPIFRRPGDIEGYLSVALDMSDRKKAENDLRAALVKERDLNELKTRFVSMVSHEFRTPLSTVLSSAYLISKYTLTEESPKREKHINRIVSSVKLLTDILNDFLSVGKMEEGKIQVRPSKFSIADNITSTTSDIYELLKPGQKIVYEHEGPDEVYLDQSMLKHILINLCSNAIKFSPENSLIHISSNRQNGSVQVSVRDEGFGISEEDQEHLFERFFRGTNVSHIQGTGLGLHIVSKYVQLMNGTISCESTLGEGSTFNICFNIQ